MKLIIIGGVAGGATAAAKARRESESCEITVFEKGPFVSFANCGLPYYVGGEITDRNKLLLMTPESFWSKNRVNVKINHEVIRIHTKEKKVSVKDPSGKILEEPYDKLILSQGAFPVLPPIRGVDKDHVFTLRDIPNMDAIVDYLAQALKKNMTNAVVVGGGFIGLEMAEAFHSKGLDVTVLERFSHILPHFDFDIASEVAEKVSSNRMRFLSSKTVVEVTDTDVVLDDGQRVPADIVLISAGVKPEVTLAIEAGLEIGTTGGIKVNALLESSDPDIYAVGDAAETTHMITGARVRIPLAGPANRQGRIAGANAMGKQMRYQGALGTSVVRLINMIAGSTGLNSQQAEASGFTFLTSVTRDLHHAGYYPGAKIVVSKVIVEESTGRILGAQVFGEDGVDKRIDVFATAIAARMTMDDLASVDLAYSPPFGTANDPVNTAAFVASHMINGDIKCICPDQTPHKDELILDVRNPDELEKFGTFSHTISIPLPELRDRIEELDINKEYWVLCQKGQRGYLATKILKNRGFKKVKNIAGGFWQAQANHWK